MLNVKHMELLRYKTVQVATLVSITRSRSQRLSVWLSLAPLHSI